MLAEDNATNQKFAIRALTKAGHTVTVANNGQEAVDAWAAEEFDAVLMDIQMPVMDGYLATGEIRQRESATNRHTPIIAMTAHAMKGDKEKCLEAGMDGYVTKPVKTKELLAEISRVVELISGNGDSGSHDRSLLMTDALDKQELLEELDGDREFLEESVEMLGSDAPNLLKQIHQALDRGDAEAVRIGAHTIKSMVGNFFAQPAFQAAFDVEKLGRSGDLTTCTASLVSLETEISRLQMELRKVLDEMS